MNEFRNSNKRIAIIFDPSLQCVKFVFSCCLMLFSSAVFSQEKQLKLTPVDSLLPMLGGLIVILVFIFGLAFLFKRFTNFSPSSKNIKILETQMIGTKEKLVIVQVQQQSFLIGVTANSISQLGELDMQPQLAAENQPGNESDIEPVPTTDFKSVLSKIVRNSVGLKSGSDHVNNKLMG